MHGVFAAITDVVDADPDCDEGVCRREDVGDGSVAVFFELGYLVYEGDGEVVVEGCAGQVSRLAFRYGGWGAGAGLTHYSVDMSAPAKAKSQSCFLQLSGEVMPGWTPQFVRYSIQFGPPSAVAVWVGC